MKTHHFKLWRPEQAVCTQHHQILKGAVHIAAACSRDNSEKLPYLNYSPLITVSFLRWMDINVVGKGCVRTSWALPKALSLWPQGTSLRGI